MSGSPESTKPRWRGASAVENTTDVTIFTEDDPERKRFDTLAARAALAGHNFQKLGSGYLLSRWGHVRHFVDLDGAEAAVQRIEGGRR